MDKTLPDAKRIFRRIIVIFLLAIILPSVLLGYFGIYAIESEKLVLKGNIRENHIAVANLVYAQLKEQILERERKVRRDVNLFLPAEYGPHDVAQVMDRLRLVHKIVKESFLITDQGKLLYPLEIATEGIGQNPSSRMLTTVPQDEFSKHIELEELYTKGRKLEFSDKNFMLAIEKYEQLAGNDLNVQLAAVGGFSAARCLSKMNRHAEAVQRYKELFAVSPSVRLMEGLPVPLESHLAAAAEYNTTGQEDKTAQLLLDAYSTLLDYGYPLTLEEFHSISKRIRGQIDLLAKGEKLLAGDQAQYSNLQSLEELRKVQDKYAGIVKTSFLPQLVESFAKPAAMPQTGRHLTADPGGEKVTLMFFFPFKVGIVGGHTVRYLYGCVLNNEYVRELAEELVSGERFAEGLVVVLKSTDDVVVVSPGAPGRFADSLDRQTTLLSAELSFTEILPYWKIGVYYLNMAKLDRWISRRLISHVATVILLMVVILVGVFLSLRGISREIELAKMKSDFVSNVSHELKTPLTSIRMFAEMLNTGRVRDPDKQKEYFALMTAETERLSRLINNVLDFSRVEEGRKKYNFVTLDASELMEESVQIIQPHTTQKDFMLEVVPSEDPLPITGDKDSLEQVLLNILNNAVKYSGEIKEIKASAYADNGEAVIEIEDKGIGIAEEELPKIFSKFYRADSRPGYESAGTGLGLTLAQQIVIAHGGHIEVRSAPGKGSTFSVVLPLAQEQDKERSQES